MSESTNGSTEKQGAKYTIGQRVNIKDKDGNTVDKGVIESIVKDIFFGKNDNQVIKYKYNVKLDDGRIRDYKESILSTLSMSNLNTVDNVDSTNNLAASDSRSIAIYIANSGRINLGNQSRNPGTVTNIPSDKTLYEYICSLLSINLSNIGGQKIK